MKHQSARRRRVVGAGGGRTPPHAASRHATAELESSSDLGTTPPPSPAVHHSSNPVAGGGGGVAAVEGVPSPYHDEVARTTAAAATAGQQPTTSGIARAAVKEGDTATLVGGDSCHVLTYNLSILPFGVRLQRAHDYKDDRLLDFVTQVGPSEREGQTPRYDVLLLQEVFSSPFVPRVARGNLCRQQRLVALLQDAGYAYHAVPKQPSLLGMISRLKATDTGLVIASRHPISERASHVVRTADGSPRGVLFAKVELPQGNSLLCFSVRLPQHGTTTGTEIAEVRQFINGIAHQHPACPIVLGGHLGVNAILQPAQRDSYGFIYDGTTQQSAEYSDVLQSLDRQERLVDVALDAYGQHVASRPPDAAPMEAERGLLGQQYTARTDFLLVSREAQGATPSTSSGSPTPLNSASTVSVKFTGTQIVRFTATDNRPYKYLSDHFGTATTVQLPRRHGAANRAVASGGVNGNGTNADSSARAGSPAASSPTASTVPATSSATTWLTTVGTWLQRGHTVNRYWVSYGEITLFVALCLVSLWYGLAFAAAYASLNLVQRLFPKSVHEPPFGIVTESVKTGIAPIDVPKVSGSPKHGTSPSASSSSTKHRPSAKQQNEPTTFGAAWRSTLNKRSWLPCLGYVEDTAAAATGGSQGGLQWLTVDDVDQYARKIRQGLQAIGVEKGGRLGVFADPQANVVATDLACLIAGIATVPLAGDPATLRCQLQSTNCSVVLTTRGRLDTVLDSRASSLTTVILAELTSGIATASTAQVDERLRRDATARGLELLTFQRLLALADGGSAGGDAPPSSTSGPVPVLATSSSASLRASQSSDVRATDPATILCDVGEEVPAGKERQVQIRFIDQRHLMAMVSQMHSCRVLAREQELADAAGEGLAGDIRSPGAASSSEHRIDGRRGTPLVTARGRRVLQDRGIAAVDGTVDRSEAASLRSSLFPFRGCLLAHHAFSDAVERIAVLSAIVSGIPVATSDPQRRGLRETCRIVRPSILIIYPELLFTLRAQVEANSLRQQSWRAALFRMAYALRLRLQGRSRDLWLMNYFFHETETMFGGRLSTLVVPTLEHLPYSLRDFVSVCFTNRVREVAFVPDCGLITVEGMPPPNTLVRIVDKQQEATAAQSLLGDAGELTLSGPAVLADSGSSTGWAHTGVMGRWMGNQLSTICPRDGLLWPMVNVSVAAPQLEREYLSRSHLAMHLFLTCRPMRPIVAIVVPRRDAVEELSHQRGDHGVGQLPWPEFARIARPLILDELNSIAAATNLPFAHIVRAVHLHPHPLTQHTSFFSQHMSIRRNRVARYFETAIDALYSEIGRQHDTASGTAGNLSYSPPQHATRRDSGLGGGGGGDRIGTSSAIGSPMPAGTQSPTPGSSLTNLPPLAQSAASSMARSAAPRSFVLEPNVPFAVDIGGTCAKMALFRAPRHAVALPTYVEEEEPPADIKTLFRADPRKFYTSAALERVASEPAAVTAPGDLTFLRMPSNRVPEFMAAMQGQNINGLFAEGSLRGVPATGGGAHKFARGVSQAIDGLSLEPVKEMESIIRGMQLCIESAQECIFAYDWRELTRIPHRLTMSPSAGFYPFLVVNVGSGVSIVKCVGPNVPYVRVGGTPIGGGTFWGLARALTNVRTWEDVKELTRLDGPGDNTNVDLLVGDIYGFNARDLPSRLTVDTVASCFGKFGTARDAAMAEGGPDDALDPQSGSASGRATPSAMSPLFGGPSGSSAAGGAAAFPASAGAAASGGGVPAGGSVGGGSFPDDGMGGRRSMSHGGSLGSRHAQAVDVVRSLLLMVATNVTQIAYLVSQQEHVENVFFTGGFVRENELIWRHVSRLMDYWSVGRIAAHFIQSDGFLGVLGALAAQSNVVTATAAAADGAGSDHSAVSPPPSASGDGTAVPSSASPSPPTSANAGATPPPMANTSPAVSGGNQASAATTTGRETRNSRASNGVLET